MFKVLILNQHLKEFSIEELNIGWINPTNELISTIISLLPNSLKRLNFSGTKDREAMNDESKFFYYFFYVCRFFSDIEILCNRCPNLLELDLSDNLIITEEFFSFLPQTLEVLVLSRCYAIEPMAFL